MSFQKENFSDIYNNLSPEPYIESLKRYGYRQPDFVYDALLSKVDSILLERGECQVVDVACSYGFNGRIIKNEIPYASFLQKCRAPTVKNTTVIGTDISSNALTYALKHHYVDHVICQDLESSSLTTEHAELLRGTDLVIASGAFSYVGIPTLKQIYAAPSNTADFMGWPVCSYDKRGLINFLEELFHKVEISSAVYPMRKFTCQQEKQTFLSDVTVYNPEFVGQLEDHLSVFQVTASGRRS
ncbi:class I SAM-dependent methyltransferase [Pseudomonas tremae]|uniref:class I SAM-dependent methyltransferase n=1 Tax=Pseudomonas tremae TaxID=200454 RepID=UPI000467A83D|nr:class I SAM-dependent methyltransferase [Pseudomonas tremae]